MGDDSAVFADFLTFSEAVTGFPAFRLQGTGQAELYCATVRDVVGAGILGELLAAYRGVCAAAGQDQEAVARALRREVFSNPKLGPVARQVIKLWYLGIWYQLPAGWRAAYGQSPHDRTFVVSPASFTEGLLWPTIGANPSGAKPFGYGMWAKPPSTAKAQGR